MIRYVSIKGSTVPVPFDEAVLQGFAADGGLFVPDRIPSLTRDQLQEWSSLSYPDLVFELLSLFIEDEIIPANDLRQLASSSFASFSHPDILPVVPFGSNLHVMELFHGPTLSFKDIAMGFLIRTMDYLLERKKKHLNIILATTGDTGPAAVHAAAGCKSIDCWPLYPSGMISEEQERQMTTVAAENIHPFSVENCKDGGDDLDVVVASLFADPVLKKTLRLSSVNSINWCRVMVQAAHFAYGYFRVCKSTGSPVAFSVPSGAFGNLFAGFLARKMGIPIQMLICANNSNQTLHRVFTKGIFKKERLQRTVSSAIDIILPYNFWRFLYYHTPGGATQIKTMMETFHTAGEVRLDTPTYNGIREGFLSLPVSDELTLETIRTTFDSSNYLLDPHGAVAVAAAHHFQHQLPEGTPLVCLATAHPAKFPEIIRKSLGGIDKLPDAATHPSIIRAKDLPQNRKICQYNKLRNSLTDAIEACG